ncbi:MAG: VWA domain-containing protein [Deltaproteobacteria bacterium]|nr:VWA domain-containing protein [Deltaproteobacteria bacterium]
MKINNYQLFVKSAAVLLVSSSLMLLALPTGGQEEIVVTLDSPDPFTPAFGEVVITAVIGTELEVERVSFYVDGVVLGELREPPYTLEVNIGDNVDEHEFEVVAYAKNGASGSGTMTTPGIRINEEVKVNLQQLYVTVTRQGERVQGLGRHAFEVTDEGKSQKLITFARGDIPFTAFVLLDSSLSMQGEKLGSALAGAKTFFEGMKTLDEGKLLVFSDRILHSTPFTSFPAVLTTGLSDVRARGGSAVNDHLYLAMKQLEERQGRRVVILLSDGVDSHSVLPMLQVLDKARRSQALVYWLRLPYLGSAKTTDEELPGLRSAWRNEESYQSEFRTLRQAVEESGGRIQVLRSLDEIEGAFQGILAELRDQYVLGYYPKRVRKDGSWHKVRVTVRQPGLEVRARDGYIDF